MLYGITGGIGSGKSTVSNHIRSLGYVVMDADQISRELMQYGSPLLEK
ncbi:MAG: dephospho-CoA kinase, partial [Firmicutes bacterium]|nr:dephospho-CoA kinase [Bacillota bacterium]